MEYARTYIIPYLKKYKTLMLSTILLGTLAVLSAVFLTFTSGYLISRTAEKPETILLVYIPIVAVRTFGISRAVFRYLERLLGHNAVLHILAEMRVKLYRALEPQALFIRSRFKTGDLLGTLADDVEHLQDVYIRTIFPTLIGLFLFVLTLVSLALFDWVFALFIGLCLSVVGFVYPLLSLLFMKKWQIRAKIAHSKLYALLTDAIFGISDWIISGRKQSLLTNLMQESKESHAAEKKLAYWHQTRSLQLHLYSGLIVILVGGWAGLQAGAGNILPTYIAAFTLVTIPLIEALMPISPALERVPVYAESLRRIELIEKQTDSLPVQGTSPYEQSTPSLPNASNNSAQSVSTSNQSDQSLVKPLPQQVDINFNDVSYRYPGQKEDAIKQFSLTIPQGHKVAILGKSGAGKSTLMQLLLGGLEPTQGEISIGGEKPAAYGQQIHNLLGVLNQKPYLFATTVENNIGLGKHGASREEIEQVVKQVRLDSYIHSLPEGLKTQTEESGQRFSGGERQRIALARILLKDTPIVILDEPTVGLDPETEYELIETIFETLKEKTVIWITHHLAGMNKMDQILFMDKGQLEMNGTHEELMATNERYRRLYELDSGV